MDKELERKKYLIESVKRDKNEIAKSTLALAASSLAVGVGALGTSLYSSTFISNLILLDVANVNIVFQNIAISASMTAIILGICSSVAQINNIVSLSKEVKEFKEILNDEEVKLGRSR